MVKRVQNFFVDVGEGSKALWTNFQARKKDGGIARCRSPFCS